jgi:lipopolysaccharide biosynthesis glycosyltransferase
MRKAIVVMAIGEKYRRRFDSQSEMINNYAKVCGATVKLIDTPPDSDFKRPLLAQKLLIPEMVKEFDIALFIDLDILIHPSSPSVFDFLPKEKHFAAVLEPRGTLEYKRAWSHLPHQGFETIGDYFGKRNFELSEKLKGSINGGVFVFHPSAIADMFKEYYYSEHRQGGLESYEEAPMAYLTQTRDYFHSLDPRFNAQLLYKVRGTEDGLHLVRKERRIPKFIRNIYYKRKGCSLFPVKGYNEFVSRQLESVYFLHFAGGYPIRGKS